MKTHKTVLTDAQSQKFTRITSIAVTIAMLMSIFLPGNLFAGEKSPTAELTDLYYEVDESGNIIIGTETKEPAKTIKDDSTNAYVNMSKTAEETGENEFKITLTVKTTEELKQISSPSGASVVLVFDVSDSMDWTVDRIPPYMSGWSLKATRWTMLKETAKKFIEDFLGDGTANNQVSIVVYGGRTSDISTNAIVHSTICNWTDSAEVALGTFYNYSIVSPSNAEYVGVNKTESLKSYVFNDPYYSYGNTNCQAGFRGAIKQLSDSYIKSSNSQYVIYMSDGQANCSYDNPSDTTGTTSADNAIKEAGQLKSNFPDCTIYTVGFSSDASGSKVLQTGTAGNPHVTEYFYSEDAGTLTTAYGNILKEIQVVSEAWTVTDPIPEYVQFYRDSISGNGKWEYDSTNNVLTWDLRNCTPSGSYQDGARTVYVYTLSYTVTVNPSELTEDKIYPLNKQTTLTYAFSEGDNHGVEQTADFLVPTVTTEVGESGTPDGGITKTSSVDTVRPGGSYSYTIIASNSGNATWKNVTATDVLDGDLSYIAFSSDDNVGVTSAGSKLTVDFGDIGSGQSKSVEITVAVSENAEIGTIIENKVMVKGSDGEEKTGEDLNPPTVVAPLGSITKVESVSEVTRGERYYYTITAENKGNSAWKNVVGTDILDDKYITFDSFISMQGVEVINNSGTLTITFGDIPAGESKTVLIYVKVNDDAHIGNHISNIVTATSDNYGNVDDNSTVNVVEEMAPIGNISKVASMKTVQPGDSCSYTITAANSGTAMWKNVVATDILNSGLYYVSFSSSDGVTVSDNNGTLTIDFGSIDADKSKSVTINVTVKSDTVLDEIHNMVTATSENYGEVEDTEIVTVIAPGGSITKMASVPEVERGDIYHYTITAANSGTAAWKNVVGTDTLDSNHITFNSFISMQGVTVKDDNGTLTINFGDIAPGESKSVNIYVKVNDDAVIGKKIPNTVIASGDNDLPGTGTPTDPYNPIKGVDPVEPEIVAPNGSIEKVSSVSAAERGDSYEYTITVTNSGTAIWKNVEVTDVLDSRLIFIGWESVDDVTVNESNGIFTINFDNINIGQSKSVIIKVKVSDNAEIGDRIPNEVIAQGSNGEEAKAEDLNPPVVIGPGGTIAKTASKNTVERGEIYSYTITAFNNGTAAWKNVVGTDTLDSNYITFHSCTSAQGVTVDNNNGTLTINFGDIASDESKSVNIYVRVNDNATIGHRIQNEVIAGGENDTEVDPSDPDNPIKGVDPVKPEIVAPNGSVSKTASVSMVQPGESYSYTITVSNSGGAAWKNVVATDVLNSGLYYVSFSSSIGVTISNNNGTLTIDFGNIDPNTSKTVQINVRVREGVPSQTIRNTVKVTSDNDTPKEDWVDITVVVYGGEDPTSTTTSAPTTTRTTTSAATTTTTIATTTTTATTTTAAETITTEGKPTTTLETTTSATTTAATTTSAASVEVTSPRPTDIVSLDNVPADEIIQLNPENFPSGYVAVQYDDDTYIIYDENGVPLGYIVVPEGKTIEEMTLDDMIPLGMLETLPVTGGMVARSAGIAGAVIFGIGLMLLLSKNSKKKRYMNRS